MTQPAVADHRGQAIRGLLRVAAAGRGELMKRNLVALQRVEQVGRRGGLLGNHHARRHRRTDPDDHNPIAFQRRFLCEELRPFAGFRDLELILPRRDPDLPLALGVKDVDLSTALRDDDLDVIVMGFDQQRPVRRIDAHTAGEVRRQTESAEKEEGHRPQPSGASTWRRRDHGHASRLAKRDRIEHLREVRFDLRDRIDDDLRGGRPVLGVLGQHLHHEVGERPGQLQIQLMWRRRVLRRHGHQR